MHSGGLIYSFRTGHSKTWALPWADPGPKLRSIQNKDFFIDLDKLTYKK